MSMQENQEYQRLGTKDSEWKRWGPYLSNRQWGTVREQYNLGPLHQGQYSDEAWHNLRYHEARATAYQFGEDGILGISDEDQYLCFSLAFWNHPNTTDPETSDKYSHIKERFFGLSGLFGVEDEQGSQCEDVKELYYYLDNTPTHSYMKAIYKYPCKPYPYRKIIENNKRHKDSCIRDEYEVLDTDVFANDEFFDITVEYAKQKWNDIVIRISVVNRSGTDQQLTILPTLFFRNTWAWGKVTTKPEITQSSDHRVLIAKYNSSDIKYMNDWHLWFSPENAKEKVLFTDNETNQCAIDQSASEVGHCTKDIQPNKSSAQRYKDGISKYIVNDNRDDSMTHADSGTKCAIEYNRTMAPHETWYIDLRLSEAPTKQQVDSPSSAENLEDMREVIHHTLIERQSDSKAFYEQLIGNQEMTTPRSDIKIFHQALSTLLWNKQFYHYNVSKWLFYRSLFSSKDAEGIKTKLNKDWQHMSGGKIMLVPDKWEYPYFCAWDSAFHAVTIALVDHEFAKEQLRQLTEPDCMRFDGQMPGCEFEFSDVNPPIHAWAAWKVYEMGKNSDHCDRVKNREFLEEMIWRLWKNFQWWRDARKATRKTKAKPEKKNEIGCYYKGGFMGLDNISVVDRNHFTGDNVFIEQVDSAAWMGFFALCLLQIAVKLGEGNSDNQSYRTIAKSCVDIFLEVEKTLNTITNENFVSSWDMEDYWYYDILRIELPLFKLDLPLRIRSIAGVIPLFATEIVSGSRENNEVLQDILMHLKEKGYVPNTHDDHVSICTNGKDITIEFALVNQKKFAIMMDRILNENEFLSKYGIRSLSKYHEEHPFMLDGKLENKYGDPLPIDIRYEPGTTGSNVFGVTNSNWRGPVWMPLNYLFIEMLRKRARFEREKGIKRPVPTLSADRKTYSEIADFLADRLISLFSRSDDQLIPPCHGQNDQAAQFYRDDRLESELLLFYEYFHAETGAGLGASHQGWTTLVANLINEKYNRTSADGRPA